MERFGVPRGKRPRVQVSLDEKERAIARIRSGETKAGISRELGVPESTVRGWVKRAEQRMAREAALEPAANGYPSILAMALAKPQLTITQAPSTPSTPSPSLALQSLKLPQKRSFNGHLLPPPPPPIGSNPLQHLAAATPISVPATDPVAVPISVPLSMPFPVPSFDSTNVELPVLGWLQIFNAGILNFTLITTAALLQARSRGLSDSLPLWQIIRDYADEAARNVAANGGHYVKTSAPPIKPTTQVARMTSPRHRQLRTNRVNTKAPLRLHITAEDDEDCSSENEVDL